MNLPKKNKKLKNVGNEAKMRKSAKGNKYSLGVKGQLV
jgi:Holliday junction resolvase RusA-like endonuclease